MPIRTAQAASTDWTVDLPSGATNRPAYLLLNISAERDSMVTMAMAAFRC